MKKFCSGDIVPGWPPVPETAPETSLQDAFAACLFQNQSLGNTLHTDERRSDLHEANAA